jgi:hypothetical protein
MASSSSSRRVSHARSTSRSSASRRVRARRGNAFALLSSLAARICVASKSDGGGEQVDVLSGSDAAARVSPARGESASRLENARDAPGASSCVPGASRARWRVTLTCRRRVRVSHRASTRTRARACVAHTTATATGRFAANRALVLLRTSASAVDASTSPPSAPETDLAKDTSRRDASMATGERRAPGAASPLGEAGGRASSRPRL